MDDWEVEDNSLMKLGKTFGGRGRGFIAIVDERDAPVFKNHSQKNDFGIKKSPFNNIHENGDDLKTENCDRQNWGDKRKINGNSNFDDAPKTEKPKTQSYIPPERLDVDELFKSGISSGINFSKYNDIQVKVSGENIPRKIDVFEQAGLCDTLLNNIRRSNYKNPTPIQKYSIPIIMSGRDMLACAQTGSGKTAAFLIPIINSLLQEDKIPDGGDGTATPQVLILSPTRELSIQTYTEAKKFTHGTKLTVEIIYGGTSVRHQMNKVQSGCNLLIATPGRLIDFLKRSNLISLANIQYFVLDEADRMLDLNFMPEVEKVLAHPTMRKEAMSQTSMFSATFPEDVQKLAARILKDYIFVAVGIVGGACEDVDQKFYAVTKFEKRAKLIELLKEHGSGKVLVFVEHKRTADIIAAFLCEKDFPATSMHGDRQQVLREEALRDFRSGRMDILVATAVAARGLDIKGVAHVINFDLPKSIDEYVHRIGRTGRVGNKGLASSFYDSKSDSSLSRHLVKILKQANQEVPEFLGSMGEGGGGGWGSSKFGARDIRRHGSHGEFSSNVVEDSTTYDEEVW